MGRFALTLVSWLAAAAMVVACYIMLGVAFPDGLPGIARALAAVLLVVVSIGGLLLLWHARPRDDGGQDDDGSDDGGRGGGGGGGSEPWPWRWPTGDGGSALRVPDYVPEEWLPAQPLEPHR